MTVLVLGLILWAVLFLAVATPYFVYGWKHGVWNG